MGLTSLETQDIVCGEGPEARRGSTVTIHYGGWLEDGERFAASRGQEPLTFELGAGEVIEGWEQGIVGMRRGGKRRLRVPAALAYRSRGVPGVVPPGSDLTFEIELLRVA